MNELLLLIKLNFQQLLLTFSVGKNKKKNVSVLSTLFLIVFLALYLSGIYSWLIGLQLKESGMLDFLLPLMMLLAVVMSLIFSFFGAGGVVFGHKDSDFMLSLPVGAFTVMLSKMTALYLENLVFTGLFMLPAGVSAWLFGLVSSPLFWLRLAAVVLFLPFLPSLLASLFGYLVTWSQSRLRHKALIASLLSLLMLSILLLLCMQINQLGLLLLTHKKTAEKLFMTWLAPIGLLGKGLLGSPVSLLLGLLFCLLPFLLVTWLFSTRYKQILSGLSASLLRSDYRLTQQKSRGPFLALFAKEVRRLFSTTIYLMNTCISVFMLLGFAVFVLVARSQTAAIVSALGDTLLPPMLLGCMAFMLALIYPSAVSVSLEGKNLWLLKEAPLPAHILFGAKAALNLLLAWPAALAATLLFALATDLSAAESLGMLAVALTLTAFLAVAGLILNLHFPKLDCDNETFIIKQSASAMFGCLGGMGTVLICSVLWLILWKHLSFLLLCLLTAVLFLVLTALLWRYLMTRGREIFMTL